MACSTEFTRLFTVAGAFNLLFVSTRLGGMSHSDGTRLGSRKQEMVDIHRSLATASRIIEATSLGNI
ncbi:transmembrane protein, putative [Medicago truncatula]|uniref:Transmembrane protein, putative n=1 Tax=Medicago truncatula TaxID=3880 RepID=G7ZVA9_MEDTR|nr:transmembrane protein, putative [Medicago truncatula]